MDDSELEEWFDELYQMMLLAYLEMDHENRQPQIDTLKSTVNGGTI